MRELGPLRKLPNSLKTGNIGFVIPGALTHRARRELKLTEEMIRDIDVIRKRKDYYDSLEQMD